MIFFAKLYSNFEVGEKYINGKDSKITLKPGKISHPNKNIHYVFEVERAMRSKVDAESEKSIKIFSS